MSIRNVIHETLLDGDLSTLEKRLYRDLRHYLAHTMMHHQESMETEYSEKYQTLISNVLLGYFEKICPPGGVPKNE